MQFGSCVSETSYCLSIRGRFSYSRYQSCGHTRKVENMTAQDVFITDIKVNRCQIDQEKHRHFLFSPDLA